MPISRLGVARLEREQSAGDAESREHRVRDLRLGLVETRLGRIEGCAGLIDSIQLDQRRHTSHEHRQVVGILLENPVDVHE